MNGRAPSHTRTHTPLKYEYIKESIPRGYFSCVCAFDLNGRPRVGKKWTNEHSANSFVAQKPYDRQVVYNENHAKRKKHRQSSNIYHYFIHVESKNFVGVLCVRVLCFLFIFEKNRAVSKIAFWMYILFWWKPLIVNANDIFPFSVHFLIIEWRKKHKRIQFCVKNFDCKK